MVIKKSSIIPPYHLLKESKVKEWNKWWLAHPGAWLENALFRFTNERIDIDLSGESLANLDLTGVILNGANLRKTNFHKTKLSRASLLCADCTGACFIESDLSYADLSFSILNNVDFSYANLEHSVLDLVSLENVMFHKARRKNMIINEMPLELGMNVDEYAKEVKWH